MCDIVHSLREQLVEIENISTNDCEYEQPHFENLPVEIILNICSYLDPYFLRNTFSKVCRRFEDILADDHLWKHWVHSKINGCFPTLLDSTLLDELQINWEEVCIDMDVEKRKWSNVKDTMTHIVVNNVHFASVDTVLLVNKGELCISGGRDRSMALWDVPSLNQINIGDITLRETLPQHIKPDAHAGWIWDLAPDNKERATKIFSASWDNTVKVWDIETGIKCIETFKCGMSALSVVCTDDIVVTGLFSKKILLFDLRAGENPVNWYKVHKGPVLTLRNYGNMVASISEDKTLAVWDKVAGKVRASGIKIPTDKAYPVCISWSPTALYVGDSKGSLHLMHPEKFTHVKTHEIWSEPPVTKPPSKITSCYQSPGNLIVCSDRGEIKFFYNCYPPHEYVSIEASTSALTQMRYENGVMVTGTCDSGLEFWIPNEMFNKESQEHFIC